MLYPKIRAIVFIEFFKSPALLAKMLFREKHVVLISDFLQKI